MIHELTQEQVIQYSEYLTILKHYRLNPTQENLTLITQLYHIQDQPVQQIIKSELHHIYLEHIKLINN